MTLSSPLDAQQRSLSTTSQRVVLNVGGTRFETTLQTLLCFPRDSVIGRTFGGESISLQRDPDGSYFFDRDAKAFAVLLQAARTGRPPVCPADMSMRDWVDEIQYWGMKGDPDEARDEELQERKRSLDSRINDSRMRIVRTIALVLSKRAMDPANKRRGNSFEFLAPKENPVEAFDDLYPEIKNDPTRYDLPSSFSWSERLGNKEIRTMLRKSGYVARIKQIATRFRVERAGNYPPFRAMIGDTDKKTVTVMRLCIEPTTAANDEDSEVLEQLQEEKKKKRPRLEQRQQHHHQTADAVDIDRTQYIDSEGSEDDEESSQESGSNQAWYGQGVSTLEQRCFRYS